MEQLKNTENSISNGIVSLFAELSAIPHPSGGEAALSRVLEARLTALGGLCQRDEAGNLRCDLPATAGLEEEPLLCVQGHLDMVCAVAPDADWDPQRDGVTCVCENGVLRSDGRSSLGADNLLGVTTALWLIESGAPHAPLRLLLTVEEEVGLKGAQKVPKGWLDGVSVLINTDGFQAKRCIIAAAGGERLTFFRPIQRKRVDLPTYTLILHSYPGGHSGFDIGKGRENPIRLLAAVLAMADAELVSFHGGQAMNAIPSSAEATICVRDESRLTATLQRLIPADHCTLTPCDSAAEVWSDWDRQALLDFLLSVPIGVQNWRTDLPHIPAASTNLGVVRSDENGVTVELFIRAAHAVVQERDANGAVMQGERRGFVLTARHSYAPWEGSVDQPFARRLADCWAERGHALEITAVHVGLEPAALLEGHSEVEAICIGPTIYDAHSTEERAPLEELETFAELLSLAMRNT